MIADFAVRREFARSNVVNQGLKDIGRIPRTIIRTFTQDQIVKLLAECEVRRPAGIRRQFELTRVMVNIAVFCGLRIGEIYGLTRGNVDLTKRVLRVRHSLTQLDELRPPKTSAGVRDVPMPQHVCELLSIWMQTCMVPEERGLVFRTGSGRGGDAGKMLLRSNFHHGVWLPLLERAGLADRAGDHFHFHALRHFSASYMIHSGIGLIDVASLLGHAKFDVTLQIYAHSIVGGSERTAAIDGMANTLLAHKAASLPRNSSAKNGKPLKTNDSETVIKAFWNVDGSPWLTQPIQLENGFLSSPFVGLDVPSV